MCLLSGTDWVFKYGLGLCVWMIVTRRFDRTRWFHRGGPKCVWTPLFGAGDPTTWSQVQKQRPPWPLPLTLVDFKKKKFCGFAKFFPFRLLRCRCSSVGNVTRRRSRSRKEGSSAIRGQRISVPQICRSAVGQDGYRGGRLVAWPTQCLAWGSSTPNLHLSTHFHDVVSFGHYILSLRT